MINKRRMRELAYLFYLLGGFIIVVSLALSVGASSTTASEASSLNRNLINAPAGQDDCGPYDVKIENGPPWSYTTPNGELIQKVTIKAGSHQQGDPCFPFSYPPEVQQDACYRVTGLGTSSTSVTIIGGDECKDISYIAIVFMDATPTPTDTSTPTSTPTDTSTPTPTPTDTSTPTPTPTDTDTPTPTSTETNTPTPTSTETNTPTPTSTETNTPTPTPTGTNTLTPTPTDTSTPGPTSTDTNTPTPTDTATPGPSPTNTNTPKPKPTDTETPVPTLPAPSPDPGDEVLIPVTGIDLSFQQSVMVRFFYNLGLVFLGIGIVLHGLSLRMKDEG